MSPDLNIAKKAALNASDVLNQMSRQTESLSVSKKQDRDYVSVADRASEHAIVSALRKARPEDAILAEESGRQGPANAKRVWIVDPLDGTRNFLHGIPHYSISIALQENGEIREGLVYDPNRDEMFHASRGKGAFLNNRRIRIEPQTGLQGGLIATGFPFRNKDRLSPYVAQFKAVFRLADDIRRIGSAALDLAYVACGRVDGFWEYGLQPWDIAAGALLVQEAGGQCLDFDGKNTHMESGNIIAGSLKVAAELVNITRGMPG